MSSISNNLNQYNSEIESFIIRKDFESILKSKNLFFEVFCYSTFGQSSHWVKTSYLRPFDEKFYNQYCWLLNTSGIKENVHLVAEKIRQIFLEHFEKKENFIFLPITTGNGSYYLATAKKNEVIETVEEDYNFEIDIEDQPDSIVVTCNLPGISAENLSVTAENEILTISGHNTCETEKRNKNYLIRERRAGKFERSFQLPPEIDSSTIEAKLLNGILTIYVKKQEISKPKKINIRT